MIAKIIKETGNEKWVVAFPLMVLASSISAEPMGFNERVAQCRNLASYGEMILSQRMNGAEKDALLKKAQGNSLTVRLVEMAYDIEKIDDPRKLADALHNFKNELFEVCTNRILNR